jgi:hypothetical protein
VRAVAEIGVDCSWGGSSATTAGSEERRPRLRRTNGSSDWGDRQRSGGLGFDPVIVDPGINGGPIEVEPLSPLDERDSALGDEAADVADADTEMGGDALDVEQGAAGRPGG